MDDALLDDLLKPGRWSRDRCPVAQALDLIEDEGKRAKVSTACDRTDIAAARIVAALLSLINRSPAEETIRKHQKRDCGCSR